MNTQNERDRGVALYHLVQLPNFNLMKTEEDTPQSNTAAVLAMAEQTADPLMQACQRLERRAKRLAESLAECAGYIASVNTERTSEDAETGETWALQTMDWAEGAKEIADRADVELGAYDEENESLLPNIEISNAPHRKTL